MKIHIGSKWKFWVDGKYFPLHLLHLAFDKKRFTGESYWKCIDVVILNFELTLMWGEYDRIHS